MFLKDTPTIVTSQTLFDRVLAVVSALFELGLCQDLESYLEQIHSYVDTYEEAFRNSKEEVVWPLATF
jgi:hypothetical protein